MTPSLVQEIPININQILTAGLQEIIGKSGLNALLNTAGVKPQLESSEKQSITRNEATLLGRTLDKIYGPRGGRGIALRAGRAVFKYYLKGYNTCLEFTASEYKILPHHLRIKKGLENIAIRLNQDLSIHIQVTEKENAWVWMIADCPECHSSKDADYSCQFTIGFLQEFLSWASSGKIFLVSETACKAKNEPACVFEMEKKPLE